MALIQQRAFAPSQRAPAQTSTPVLPHPTNNVNLGVNSNIGRNPPMKKLPHDIETCSATEELLQRMIDQGQLEVGNKDTKEQHVCMQSVDREATNIDSLSAKVTNITGLSGITYSGRIIVALELSVQLANTKEKAKVVTKEANEANPTSDEDVPGGRFTKKGEGLGRKEVSLEEANEFLCIIQQSEFKIIE